MKSKFNNLAVSDYGNNLRDDILQFQLDNEVGNNLIVNINGAIVTLQLQSKSGKVLGEGSFETSVGAGIKDVYLDNENQQLVFILGNDDVLYCSLSDLYIDEYVKSASVYEQTLTLTLSDGNILPFTPTENNFTDALKNKLDNLESNAQVNTIESINLDGVPQSIQNKTVNLYSEIIYIDSLEWVEQSNILYFSPATATDLSTLTTFINQRWGINNASVNSKLFAYDNNPSTSENTVKFCTIKSEQPNLYYIDVNSIDNLNLVYIYLDSNKLYRVKSKVVPTGVGFLEELSPSISLGETATTAFPGNRGKANETAISNLQLSKQDALVAGNNIDIEGNVISAIIPVVTIDTEIDPTSTRAVENKAIAEALALKQNTISNDNKISASYVSGLSNVATSGSYNDLSNKPNLATVATTGSYDDLTNKPVIPEGVVVDSELSLQSENPVQNKVITNALNNKQDTISASNKISASNISGLASVATTGNYNDLSNKYTLPKATTSSLGGIVVGDHLNVDGNGKVDVDVEGITGGFITKTEADGYYVGKSTTIAGVDLQDNITASELKTGLSLTKSDVGLSNVTNVSTTDTISSGNTSNITSGAVYTKFNSVEGTISTLDTNKQDKLTAGVGISISNNVISATSGVSMRVVQELPTTGETNVIYLVAVQDPQLQDIYAEYIWVSNVWEKIGTTQTSISGYVPTSRTIAGINLVNDIAANSLKSALSLTKSDVGLGNVTNVSTTSYITEGSTSNVTSGAVYTALQGKEPSLSTMSGYDATKTQIIKNSQGTISWNDYVQETLNVTPTTSAQTITPSTGYDNISQVNVSAVTSSIDSNIQASNILEDVSILGVTGTLPSEDTIYTEIIAGEYGEEPQS